MSDRLLDDLLACVDQRQLDAVVRRHVTELINDTLDEWDDAARWRTLVTALGRDRAQELATIAVRQTIRRLFEGVRDRE